MKKLLSIAIALVMVLLIAVPALASGGSVGTGVEVVSGGGQVPVIKCKWETPDNHPEPFTQVDPVLSYKGEVEVTVYAVVADLENKGLVAQVIMDVFHPEDPLCGSLKFSNLSLSVLSWEESKAMFAAANTKGIVRYNTGYDYADVNDQLNEDLARVWKGTFKLNNCQPAGDYTVTVRAADTVGNVSAPFSNTFLFVPTAGIEVDFVSVQYPPVMVGQEVMLGGDYEWASTSGNKPTVRNIGNVYTKIGICQTDMGFGRYGDTGAWKVFFDARLGPKADEADSTKLVYMPEERVVTPNFLKLCEVNKLDFSIHVVWADTVGPKTGTMTLTAVEAPFEECDNS